MRSGRSLPPRDIPGQERLAHPLAWWLWALGLAAAVSRLANPLLLLLAIGVVVVVVLNRRDPSAPGSLTVIGFIGLAAVVMRLVVSVVFGSGRYGPTVLVDAPVVPLPDWLGGVRLGGPITAEGLASAGVEGLRLAAGEGAQRSATQSREPEQVEGLLDSAPHCGRGHAEGLHAEGELVLDDVGDEGSGGALPDRADEVGEVSGAVRAGVPSADRDAAGEGAPGEMRDQTVEGAEQGRLAAAGRPDDEDELSLADAEVNLTQGRARGVGIPHADATQRDHDDTTGTGVVRVAGLWRGGAPASTAVARASPKSRRRRCSGGAGVTQAGAAAMASTGSASSGRARPWTGSTSIRVTGEFDRPAATAAAAVARPLSAVRVSGRPHGSRR